jgi:FkbH-like protein
MEVLNLYHRGIILGLCSKNNLEDILEVLDERSEMVLKKEHFAIMKVNWQDKVKNLREIASELNIGLDSIVFVDDSDFEINLVQKSLPEVTTVQISSEKPYENRMCLLQGGWFDSHVLTEEDRLRAKMYRAEVERKNLASSITDMSEYLESLKMKLTLEVVTEADLDRVAQLCQRTNQFNLTTKRYSRDEIAIHRASPASTPLLLRLSDRFGDYGIIGFCLAINKGEDLHLDTFLMSCRALGRGVETAFLAMSCQAAATEETLRVIGSYSPTKKNTQVANFYLNNGFSLLDETNNEIKFSLEWKADCILVPPHFNTNKLT